MLSFEDRWGIVMVLLRIVRNEVMPYKISIIDQINKYARRIGLLKKEGAFFYRTGEYAGTMYTVGKMAGIDMMEWR